MTIKVEIKPYHGLPCALEVFTINGEKAQESDFGEGRDDSPESAEDYACGDHQFHPKLPTQEVLDKYKINLSEYAEICGKLESALSVGSCGWCV